MYYLNSHFLVYTQNYQQNSTSKSIENSTNIDQKPTRHENEERHHRPIAMPIPPTPQQPKLDLHHVHQRQHQEHRPANRAHRRHHVPDPKGRSIHMGQIERPEDPVLVVSPAGEPDGLLQSQRHQAGEEEAAEGVDVEGDQILRDFGARGASGLLGRVD